ncbi:MAG TPA: UbiA-like polyprenyltransferase [Candidatus Thermoplasmatota archaeon]|nr:UbiA-like polyprenyltransferase [Candidatus Thermoplasmatota archaeon]
MTQVVKYAAARKPSTVKTVLEFVKIEHSLFALPFVLAGALLGFLQRDGALTYSTEFWTKVGLVLVAAVGARTLAMTLNRIVDAGIDARNPRTATRALPAGAMSTRRAWAIAVVSAGALFWASAALNPLCLLLAPVLVGLFFLYPYTKRFTWLCHGVLGLAFLCAPAGGYLAVTGGFEGYMAPLVLAVAAAAWVTGFDIIYALLDVEFDRANGIRSVPAAFGVRGARLIALGLHAVVIAALFHFWFWHAREVAMLVAAAAASALILYQHLLVDPNDAGRINKAFFNVNAVVGWVVLAGLIASQAMAG